MVNILLFTHHLTAGGAEKTVCSLAEYINENEENYRALICVVYDDPDKRKQLTHSEIIVLKNKSGEGDGKLKKVGIIRRQAAELRKIKQDRHIDICISFLPGADILNMFSRTGEKTIVSVRNTESYFTHTVFKKWYVQYSYRNCDKIVSVSEYARQDTIRFFGVPEEKVITIHNAVEPFKESAFTDRKFENFIRGRKVILNVGRISSQKGQNHLAKSFEAEYRRGKLQDACLVIVGGGEERFENIKKYIEQCHAEDHIYMTGATREVGYYLSKADLFVLSSNVEGMSNAVLEAMRMGLPVLATDCGGTRELLAPGTDLDRKATGLEYDQFGLLLPVCSKDPYEEFDPDREEDCRLTREEEYMGDAMDRILHEEETMERYRRASAGCIKQFSWQVIEKLWIGAVQEVCGDIQ